MKRKIIAIIGPTASGKTGIGVRIAKEFNGEIISADSRQLYRGLDLGTGKEGESCLENPKSEIRNPKQILNPNIKNSKVSSFDIRLSNLRNALRFVDGVPQWMIDVAEPGEHINLFDYLAMARIAIEDIFSMGKLPIIVGGTGLYIQALTEGFELELNQKCNQKSKINRVGLEGMTTEELKKVLFELDPEEHKKIDLKNPHRIIRSIERVQEGLRPIKIKPDFEVLQIAIDLPRKELFERIDKRVDDRFNQGMLEEVVGLLNEGVDPEWLMKLGLEYGVITKFMYQVSSIKYQVFKSNIKNIDQVVSTELKTGPEFEAMKQDLKYKIHQFARRQITWFKRFPEINWLKDYDQTERFVKIFLEH